MTNHKLNEPAFPIRGGLHEHQLACNYKDETMKTKHTQGPWAYGESVDSMWYVEAEGRIIAEVMPGNPGEAEENAQLMAAAPLMLEALLMAFDRDLTYLSDHAEIPRQDVVRARLAIHAALGLQANAD